MELIHREAWSKEADERQLRMLEKEAPTSPEAMQSYLNLLFRLRQKPGIKIPYKAVIQVPEVLDMFRQAMTSASLPMDWLWKPFWKWVVDTHNLPNVSKDVVRYAAWVPTKKIAHNYEVLRIGEDGEIEDVYETGSVRANGSHVEQEARRSNLRAILRELQRVEDEEINIGGWELANNGYTLSATVFAYSSYQSYPDVTETREFEILDERTYQGDVWTKAFYKWLRE